MGERALNERFTRAYTDVEYDHHWIAIGIAWCHITSHAVPGGLHLSSHPHVDVYYYSLN